MLGGIRLTPYLHRLLFVVLTEEDFAARWTQSNLDGEPILKGIILESFSVVMIILWREAMEINMLDFMLFHQLFFADRAMTIHVIYLCINRYQYSNMSLIKGKQEFRTILDFSKSKVSKNQIKRSLREVEVREVVKVPETNTFTFVDNYIIVGMYQLRLSFESVDAINNRTKLKEYGGFRVAIYERNRKASIIKNINLDKDKRFVGQYWLEPNKSYGLRICNLVDIIMFLNRLSNLKMFL